ncbi:MAG: hypothetical protein KAG53_10730, partial [Endozoicomonadaceae bacterium]|nr:hypothetical protein [Endozoicomonadaceae bacterium]
IKVKVKVKVEKIIKKFMASHTDPGQLQLLVRDNIRNRIVEHSQGVYFKEDIGRLSLPRPLETYISRPFGYVENYIPLP